MRFNFIVLLLFISAQITFSQIKFITDTTSQFKNLELYPNPFYPASRIWYSTPLLSDILFRFADSSDTNVLISIMQFNVPAGTHYILFDEKNMLPTGWYTYTLEARYK